MAVLYHSLFINVFIVGNGQSFSYSNIQNVVLKECESSRHNSFLPNMLNKFCEKYGSNAQIDFWLSKFRLLFNGTQYIEGKMFSKRFHCV